MDDRWKSEYLLLTFFFVVVVFIAIFYVSQLKFRSGDVGNNLAYADALVGKGPREAVLYPPLLPFLIVTATLMTTELSAVGWVMASLYIAYIAGGYAWIRSITDSNVFAVPASILIVFGPALTQLFGWFGVSTLAGLAAIAWIGWALVRFREAPSLQTGTALSVCIGVLIWAHHFTGALVALALTIHTFFHLLFDNRGHAKRLIIAGFGGLVVSLPAWPFYYNLFSSYYSSNAELYQNAFKVLTWFIRQLNRAGIIYVILPFVGTAAGFYALYASKRGKYRSATYFCVAMGVSSATFFVYLPTNKSRALYYITLPLVILLISAYKESKVSLSFACDPSRLALVMCVLIAAIQGPIWVTQTQSSVEFFQHVSDEQIELIEEHVQGLPKDTSVAILSGPNPINGANDRFAWWIEGYGNKDALVYGKREYFVLKQEHLEIFHTRALLIPGPRIESTHLRTIFDVNRTDIYVWMQSDNSGFAPAVTVQSYQIETPNGYVKLQDSPRHRVVIRNNSRTDVHIWPTRNISVQRTVTVTDDSAQLTLESSSPTVESLHITGVPPEKRTYGLTKQNRSMSQLYIQSSVYLQLHVENGDLSQEPDVWQAQSTDDSLSVTISHQDIPSTRLLGATNETKYIGYCEVAEQADAGYAWVTHDSTTYRYLSESPHLHTTATSNDTSLVRIC